MKRAITKSVVAMLLVLAASAVADAAVYINEIYFDPPGSLDSTCEYIELRGTPNASLADYSLILLENENKADNSGDPGHIDHIFDLTSASFGSNGFLTLRQKDNPYTGSLAPATASTNLVNTATGFYSNGWGDASSGPGNTTVGASQEQHSGIIENSGFTAMLIHNNGGPSHAPYLGQDLDQGNNGLDPIGSDVNGWRSNWTIVDSIGIHSEVNEAQYGRLYAPINFGPEATTNIEPGATYIGVGFEIEQISRWGDSTGQTAADWVVSNLTDNAASGYTGPGDYRQSGDPHPIGGVFSSSFHLESSHGIPYGTPMCNTLGTTNFGGGAGRWTGIGSATWSTAYGSNNWKIGSGTAIEYANYTDVAFDDTATGTTVNISAANVSPASVVFNNSTKDIVVTGSYGIAGSTGILKQGSGKVTITSVNAYTGATILQGGALQLGVNAQTPIWSGAGADIQSGKLVMDYATTAPDVLSPLTAAYGTGWTTGKFRNSTATALGMTLGWKDDTGAKQVTIRATIAGDCDLSGGVGGPDLTALLGNFNGAGNWAGGDFDYSGGVGGPDLTALLGNFNTTAPVGGAGGGMGTVPEPSSITLAAVAAFFGMIALASRRRKSTS